MFLLPPGWKLMALKGEELLRYTIADLAADTSPEAVIAILKEELEKLESSFGPGCRRSTDAPNPPDE